jgi:hypothetical protein
LYAERLLASITTGLSYPPIIGIPENLGILMGISAGSFIGAKGITSFKVGDGSITKVAAEKPSFVDLITNDYKAIDLGDAQMLAWTLIAAAAYLINVSRMWWYLDPSLEISLPNVDSTLMILTGISQAAYLGKKLVARDEKPEIKTVDPASGAKAGETIMIQGTAFGNTLGNVKLGKVNMEIVAWYDSLILAKLAAKDQREGIPGEVAVPAGKTVLCVNTAYNQTVTSSYTVL